RFRTGGGDRQMLTRPKAEDWSMENLKQQVLLKTTRDLFVLYDEWEIPYTKRRQEQLRDAGKVVKDEELRVVSRRVMQVVDPSTGKLRKHQGIDASYTMDDFAFIIGSSDDTDRALYFCTKDGHLFKGFELSGERR
ncbi:MAG: hypothetical protein KDB07_09350, partial [Planctomycetes bacterium]|nr:hypothetical protein [Planctomycetota bacterium]